MGWIGLEISVWADFPTSTALPRIFSPVPLQATSAQNNDQLASRLCLPCSKMSQSSVSKSLQPASPAMLASRPLWKQQALLLCTFLDPLIRAASSLRKNSVWNIIDCNCICIYETLGKKCTFESGDYIPFMEVES